MPPSLAKVILKAGPYNKSLDLIHAPMLTCQSKKQGTNIISGLLPCKQFLESPRAKTSTSSQSSLSKTLLREESTCPWRAIGRLDSFAFQNWLLSRCNRQNSNTALLVPQVLLVWGLYKSIWRFLEASIRLSLISDKRKFPCHCSLGLLVKEKTDTLI